MDLSKLSDDELRALLAAARSQGPAKPKGTIDNSWAADEMPWWKQGLAGMGGAFVNMARGVGQLLPGDVVSRKEVDEANARDKALMNTGWGMAGNVAGNLVPAVLAPASTLPRAALYGAGAGFVSPVGEKDSRAENTLVGGMFGAAVPVAVAAGRTVKALAEPALAPNRTAARILEQLADDPAAMRLAARQASSSVPGVQPTLAEVAQQPGISTLQRSMANQPGPLQAAFSERNLANNAARKRMIEDMAGSDGRLDMQVAARKATAEDQYARAFLETPDTTPWIKGEVTKLMQRPSFVDALKDGQRLAMDLGIKVSPKNPENSTEILHYTKMALDGKIENLAAKEGTGNQVRALVDIRDKLVSLMESKDFSPSYREARDTYKQFSRPIDEMQMAAGLRDKLIPAIEAGVEAPKSLNANSFAAEVRRRSEDLARTSPEFQGKVGDLVGDLQRRAAAESLGKPTGSPTAQYLTTQNLMRQVAGPLGMAEGFADKAAQTLMATPMVGSALSWASKGAEARVQQALAEMLMNPKTAAQAIDIIKKNPGILGRSLDAALPYATTGMPLLATGMFASNR